MTVAEKILDPQRAKAARAIRAEALAEVGRPATKPATVGNRNVQVMYSRDPWVDADGNLNVRVRVLEDGEYRGIGKLKVRDEHLRFVNPPVKVPTGAKRTVRMDGVNIELNVCEENPAAALEQIVLQTLGVIGISDTIERGVGNTTTTVYPDAGTGGTTVDGRITFVSGAADWSAIHGSTTGTADASTADIYAAFIDASTTTNKFDFIVRGITGFDTSAVGTDAISSATISLRGTNKYSTLGSFDLVATSVTLAANNDIAAGDFDGFGTAEFGSVSLAAFSTAGYNDILLNASGISHINKSGVTNFGWRVRNDLENSAPSWVSAGQAGFRIYYADQTGTTNDPKLVIEHAAVTVPELAALSVSAFDAETITLDQPTFDTEGSPAPTVEAFIGLTGTISESGGVVSDYIEGEVDVSAGGYTFEGLSAGTSYTIFVVASNVGGNDAVSVEQTTASSGSLMSSVLGRVVLGIT